MNWLGCFRLRNVSQVVQRFGLDDAHRLADLEPRKALLND